MPYRNMMWRATSSQTNSEEARAELIGDRVTRSPRAPWSDVEAVEGNVRTVVAILL